MSTQHAVRRRGRWAVLALGVLLAGCDSLLDVENPAAIRDEDLNTTLLANTLANSVKGEFQAALDDLTYFGAIVTDEAVTGHNFVQWKDIDLRILDISNTVMDNHYDAIHAARYLADTAAVRLKNILEHGSADLRTATALTFGGYAYVFAGEMLCESPINVSSTVYSAAQLTGLAVPRFEEAVQVAQAARAAGQTASEADALLNLARVGLARAHLQLGEDAEARAAAQQVSADFAWWVAYSSNSTRETNLYRGATQGANRNLGVDEGFRFLNDPRVRHSAASGRGHNNLTLLWDPFQPPSFSAWEPESTAAFDRDTRIRLASGLEARYIVAEVDGPTEATLTFVNERRAVGQQEAIDVAGEALMAELRDQRRRDFYLDGHRMGDLRRYQARGVGDFWPTGPHPNDIWGSYAGDTCIPIPLTERIGNPGL